MRKKTTDYVSPDDYERFQDWYDYAEGRSRQRVISNGSRRRL